MKVTMAPYGGKDILQRIIYTILIFCGLILLETVFVAVSTGYLFVEVKSPLFEQIGFFISLAKDDLLTTAGLILIDNPVFIIQSQYKQTGTTVWALHYFGLTLLAHIAIALIIGGIFSRKGARLCWQDIPFSGSILLLFSSLYMLLASCCTGGPNWIFQTWLLSVVFNPITSSNATIQLYQSLKGGFVLMQVIVGMAGGYLIMRHQKNLFS